jgi:hypothetical protein
MLSCIFQNFDFEIEFIKGDIKSLSYFFFRELLQGSRKLKIHML